MLRAVRTTSAWRAAARALRALGLRPGPRVAGWLHFRGWSDVSVHGHDFQLYNPNRLIETQLFWNTKGWEETSLRLFGALAPRADVILDIGANSGVYALLGWRANPAARHFAIEPTRGNLDLLRANVARNRAAITIVEAAATSFEGEITLHEFPDQEHAFSASLDPCFRPEATIARPVRAITIDGLVAPASAGALLCKIDVETHEPMVLEGMRALLEQADCAFVIEVLDPATGEKCARWLAPDAFLYFSIDDETGAIDRVQTLGATRGVMNYLVVPSNGRWARAVSDVIASVRPLRDRRAG